MKREDLLAFARKDWAALAEVKRAHRREHRDPLASFQIVDGLRAQVHAMRPDFPSARDREADLEAHIVLADRLRRASPR